MTEAHQELGSSANSYAILAKLATGGMAELFLARNASGAGIERYVVLKRVLRNRANDAAFVRMFLDEARLVAQLQHPNIAQVYDTGVLGDSYFFTMEYVHGETVREVLRRAFELKVQVPIGCALTIAAAAAAGLHHAHERIGMDGHPLDIVHRDVSPSNLMVSYEGQVKLVDFGVAKTTVKSSETNAGTVKGKISYLSPEQCRGRAIDRRSDLFSLGIVMWELIACDRLFKRETDYENMDAIVKEPVPSLKALRPDVPPEVDAIVMKLMAKDPVARFQTADEVLEAIERVAMKSGLSLSVASLARFMRELFGQRPEPWVQVKERDHATDIVTVTAEPISAWPSRGSEVTSSRLAMVPDLSPRRADDWPEGSPEPGTVSTIAYVSTRLPVANAEDVPTTASGVRARSRRRYVIGTLLACCAAVAGVVYVFGGSHDEPASQTAEPAGERAPASSAAAAPAPPPVAVPATTTVPDAAGAAESPPPAITPSPEPARATVAPPPPSRPVHHAPTSHTTKPPPAHSAPKPPVTAPPPPSNTSPSLDCDAHPMDCRR